MLEIKAIPLEFPAEANVIVGQAHFIKTVEDLYEAMCTTAPQARFGEAFNESSGACLIRSEGNDQSLRDCAVRNAQAIGAGHAFLVVMQNAYPINVLSVIRNVSEVCSIFCATATQLRSSWPGVSRAGE